VTGGAAAMSDDMSDEDIELLQRFVAAIGEAIEQLDADEALRLMEQTDVRTPDSPLPRSRRGR
jgi:hypothetical protein